MIRGKGKTVNVRIDSDLEPAVSAWLGKHPDIAMTTLSNMAWRNFITEPHVLELVEIVISSDDEVLEVVGRVELDLADALEKLKLRTIKARQPRSGRHVASAPG